MNEGAGEVFSGDEPRGDADGSMLALAWLAKNPGSTTSDVGKAVFDPEDDSEMRNADRKVRYYFEEKYPHLIVADTDGGANTYSADSGLVWFGPGRMELQDERDGLVSIGVGETLMYIDADGQPVVTVLGGYEMNPAGGDSETDD